MPGAFTSVEISVLQSPAQVAASHTHGAACLATLAKHLLVLMISVLWPFLALSVCSAVQQSHRNAHSSG